MQWNDKLNAGFSNGTPWLELNGNYKDINVAKDLSDPKSIYRFYQKLLELKKNSEVFNNGKYQLVDSDDSSIYAYTRTVKDDRALVICSFAPYKVKFDIPKEFVNKSRVLLNNYDESIKEIPSTIYLKPYEGIVLKRD
jgi:oligo-1,6-glucosidase